MEPWTYRPPYRPASHPTQCYYRADPASSHSHRIVVGGAAPEGPVLEVFRFTTDASAQLRLTFRSDGGEYDAVALLDRATLRALHAAISDALHDIAAVEDDRERRESFARISDEMREAEELGGPCVYYAHPDIHYVPADQVEAKVQALEASGATRYMVVTEPARSDAGVAA